jgi:soluble lytic murein transglycosylase
MLVCLALVGSAVVVPRAERRSAQSSPHSASSTASLLASSAYPLVPRDLSILWLVPPPGASAKIPHAFREFAEGVRQYAAGKYAQALPKFTDRALAGTELVYYARYYAGLARIGLERVDEARQDFAAVGEADPQSYLAEAAALREGEAAALAGDNAAAVAIYDDLSRRKTSAPDDVWLRIAKAAIATGDRERAAKAYLKLYYEFPVSDAAAAAGPDLEQLRDLPSVGERSARFKLELGRADRLFGGKRYAQAEPAYEALKPQAHGDDLELVTLRLAECDFYSKRYRAAYDALAPYVEHASRRAEAMFFSMTSLRYLDQTDEYIAQSNRLIGLYPTSSWTEEALNNLATYFIVVNQDDQADEVFRDLYARFPRGHYAERAAWKTGWWAYKHARYQDTVKVFESAAIAFPHSDYRPSWLYWSARCYERLDDAAAADARLRLVTTDYLNTYYGRLAVARQKARVERVSLTTTEPSAPRAEQVPQPPPTAPLIRALISLELYDQALDELGYAQRTWGESPVTLATMAWIYNKQGDLRPGINTMRRAYPQFMADGGEKLPTEILKVIFPVDYWREIRQQAELYKLDPYIVAALIAQESTFTADAKSTANAIGLMQVLPSTGRSYARTLRIKRFSPSMLTRADTNLRLGAAYFADLVKRFGAVHYALASYNAGENRVTAWQAERAGLDRDEWIDDIPFPETQNYVKRILGTAEDYRRLYAGVTATPPVKPAVAKAPATPPKKTPAVQKAKKK